MIAVKKYGSGLIALTGSDPNIHKQKSARKRGLEVSYFEIESHEKKYDVISMLNVFSHLPDPQTFLKSLKELLNAKGELILETGDTTGFSADDIPRPLYLPDHLSFASEKIVVGILERLDFEIVCIKKYPFLQFDILSITKEIIKIILPQYKSNIRCYFRWKLYAQRDMYIRARLKN